MDTVKKLLPAAMLALRTPGTLAITQQSGNERLLKFDWEFDTLGDVDLGVMLDAANQFLHELQAGAKPRWLSLLGTSGAGKTHLARKINEYFKKHILGTLVPGQNLELTRNRMRGGFVSWRLMTDKMRNGEYGAFRAACEDHFVIIDDIGAGYDSSFVIGKLDELIDARLGKWTVVTANLGLGEIKENMDARIASRMIRDRSVVIDVRVPDFNLRKKD